MSSHSEIKKLKPSTAKNAVIRTFDQFLEQHGYKLRGTIGMGSYAKVKEAEFKKNGERVKMAAKIIDRRKAPNDFLNKFLPRELNIYRKLNHPNIIKAYDIMEVHTRIFVFMELAEGGDLLDFIKKRGALSTALARRIFNELISAIKYCHSIQITHRDLKCENILLDKNNHVKLADFGFGRSCVDENNKRVLCRTYCGSAAYAAPEILQVKKLIKDFKYRKTLLLWGCLKLNYPKDHSVSKKILKLKQRTTQNLCIMLRGQKGIPYNPKLYDIWSLGCILYIMVCGSMPFDDSDIKKMIQVQVDRAVKFPSKLDLVVRNLINQMLEPDVTLRANIDKILKHGWISSSRANS